MIPGMTSLSGASYRIVGRRELHDALAIRNATLADTVCLETIWRQSEPAGAPAESLARQVKLTFLARLWHTVVATGPRRENAATLQEVLGPPPLEEACFDRFFEISRTPPPDQEVEGVLDSFDETAMSVLAVTEDEPLGRSAGLLDQRLALVAAGAAAPFELRLRGGRAPSQAILDRVRKVAEIRDGAAIAATVLALETVQRGSEELKFVFRHGPPEGPTEREVVRFLATNGGWMPSE